MVATESCDWEAICRKESPVLAKPQAML